MEKSKRQVTIIDELWDNEQMKSNRRLYDEQERTIQRQNIEFNDRVKKFEVLKHDEENETIKRALAKQAKEYQRLLAKKDEQIEGLNEKIQQNSHSNQLQTALRQANLEKLHLEKRLLSSSSSLNSTTTTQVGPTSADDPVYSSRTSTPSDAMHHQALQRTNELLRTEIQRLTQTNEDYAVKLKVQTEQLEKKNDEKPPLPSREENEEFKQKIQLLESDLLTLRSTRSHREDLQINIERLQAEIDHNIKEREMTSIVTTQLRHDISQLTSTNERITDECEKLRTALIAKSEEFEKIKRDYEQVQKKNLDLESMIRVIRSTNEENELTKQELKRKQDDFEQFQKMHDATKRENQATIHLLQEKINDLEKKTELQSVKHEEILQRFESLKQHSDRIPPSSALNTRHSLPISLESSFPPMDDSAPIGDRSPKIVVAKYTYEPLKSSPNDHPEMELPLQLGQTYLVYGEIDEDGFYDGRNLDGRYGLIPSNFIELVTNPDDLPENTKYLIQTLTGRTFSPRPRQPTPSVESDVFTNQTSIPLPKLRSISSDMSTEEFSYHKHVPHPNNLRIEKTFSNSILIAWNPPSASNMPIIGYQVLLDHALYNTIPANERTRALIENINFNEKMHRIAVRTVAQRGLSHDQQCTLLINNSKEIANQPMDLRVDRITQTGAVVSWWPAANTIVHKLYINDTEVQTLKPGVYRFKLSGLVPNTLHRVTIKAVTTPQQSLAISTEFRTSGSDESISPPRQIQVIPGPQSKTLLVSWEHSSPMNTIRAYRIYIDGRAVQDISNPLNDHTVLDLNTIHSGRYLTMRTLADNGRESTDSITIDLEKTRISPRRSSITTPDLSTSAIHGRAIKTPSPTWSMSTDVPQIDLHGNTSQNVTPINENLTLISSADEQRSIPNTPMKITQTQSPARSFIALFDYDPEVMSPNPDSEEELAFKKGQIIQIYGEQDADGFYLGRTEDGRSGYVPSNMVSELAESDIPSPIKRTPTDSKKMLTRLDSISDQLPSPTGDIPLQQDLPSSTEKDAVPKETNPSVEENKKPSPVAEPAKSSFFDRFKSTFTWNSDEPI